jgi:PTH1 family peptidyl-tRNA hydrolase
VLLVVGLGNPGKSHEGNRHNVGFMVVDALARSGGFPAFKEKFSGLWTRGDLPDGTAAVLLKPQTFMNLSGDSVRAASVFFKAEPGELVLVHDELDLPWRDVRRKVGGGHAGHNGVRHVAQVLGTPEFTRVRVGIGRPGAGFEAPIVAWVLSDFDAQERAELPQVVEKAAALVSRAAPP